MPFWTAHTAFNYLLVNWRGGRGRDDFPQASSPAEKRSDSPCPTGKVQTGLKRDWAAELLHVPWPRTSGCLGAPTSRQVQVWGRWHLPGASRSTPEPRWAFEEGAGGSLFNHIGFAVRSHWRREKTAHDRWVTGFSRCLSGEREGGRNAGLKHLPASSGMVPTCCKAGWRSSEMNPTDILKQTGLVGVASEMNSPNSPRKEKQKAASVQVPPPLTGISTCLKDGLSAFRSVA